MSQTLSQSGTVLQCSTSSQCRLSLRTDSGTCTISTVVSQTVTVSLSRLVSRA